MSLLDDVSIVVTPNAYKAGTLYGVLPTATEGSELVVNGDFATDSVWTKGTGWTISGGTANVASGSDGAALSQDICQVGVVNRVVFTISNYTGSGFVRLRTGGASQVQDFSANGTYTINVVPTSVSFSFARYVTGSLSIDNVSVKQFTASDMDVTRATAATRVDENGLVNYAEVLGSELVTNGNFDSNITGWSAKSSTIAWDNGKLKADNSSGNQYGGAYQNIGLVTGKQYKMTLTMQLLTGSSNGTFMLFTSSASGGSQSLVHTGGTLVVGGAAVTETFIFTPASGDVSIQPSCDEANATFTIDNVSVKEVTRNNVPRIDYTGGGCPHILAEPQRTNLVTYSEDFSNSYWTKSNLTASVSSVASPSSSNTFLIQETTYSSALPVFQSTGFSASAGTFNATFYVKNNSGRYLGFSFGSSSQRIRTNFDFNTETFKTPIFSGTTTGTASFTKLGDFYRISIKATFPSSIAPVLVMMPLATDTYPYYANQDSDNRSFYVWGVQIEEGSYPTSYIPTSGSSVTRNKDVFTRDGISSLINSTAGVFFIEMAALLDEGTTADKWIALSDGTANNSVRIAYSGGANTIRAYINVGGSAQADMTYAVTNVTQFSKIAFSYAANNFNLWVDGVKRATDTSGNVFSANTLNRVGLDNGGGGSFPGKIKQLQVYKTALTDAQLTSLTS